MSDYQRNFKRYEKKYILDEEQYRSFIALIYCNLKYDQYKKYKICNIYFDTMNYDLIRESVEKPMCREKLSLRSDNTPDLNDNVFLEIKKKFDGVVYKRRLALPYKEALEYSTAGITPKENNVQIVNEIGWLMSKYELRPMLYLSYDRLVMSGKEDKELRITFDTNIIWRSKRLDMSEGDFEQAKVPERHYIMEIETGSAMPMWLSNALNELKIYPQPFSKYVTTYTEGLLGTDNNAGNGMKTGSPQ